MGNNGRRESPFDQTQQVFDGESCIQHLNHLLDRESRLLSSHGELENTGLQ
jgi:hypothetical protein